MMGKLESKIDQLVNKILVKAENQHELLFGACQSDVKLTNTQEHILMLLSQDKLTNTDLAKKLNISQAAVTKAIKSLIKHGMLASSKDSVDARVTYFELTDLAKPIAEEHTHHHDKTLEVYSKLLEDFTAEEAEAVDKFLTVFAKELEG